MPAYLQNTWREFYLSTNPELIQTQAVHHLLQKTYWASHRSLETIQKSVQNSLCFGVYHEDQQIAFARIVTDYCTFAYLCDVVVAENFRSQGISKWLMNCIMNHPELSGLRRFLLATSDAHGLYEKYGFKTLTADEANRIMGIRNDEV